MYKLLNVSKLFMVACFFVSLFLFDGTVGASQTIKVSEVKCRMNFTMKSWSFLYKSGKGDWKHLL